MSKRKLLWNPAAWTTDVSHVDQKLRIHNGIVGHRERKETSGIHPLDAVTEIADGSGLPIVLGHLVYDYSLPIRQLLMNSAGATAVLLSEGSVQAWGYDIEGGDIKGIDVLERGVTKIFAHYNGFSAVTIDGKVVTWGNGVRTPPEQVLLHLQEDEQVCRIIRVRDDGNVVIYYALTNHGRLLSWRDSWVDIQSAIQLFSTVKMIQVSTQRSCTAVAILHHGGHVNTFHHYDRVYNQNIPILVPPQVKDISFISATNSHLFTAVDTDGNVTT